MSFRRSCTLSLSPCGDCSFCNGSQAISLGHLMLILLVKRERRMCDSSCLRKCSPSPKLLQPLVRWLRCCRRLCCSRLYSYVDFQIARQSITIYKLNRHTHSLAYRERRKYIPGIWSHRVFARTVCHHIYPNIGRRRWYWRKQMANRIAQDVPCTEECRLETDETATLHRIDYKQLEAATAATAATAAAAANKTKRREWSRAKTKGEAVAQKHMGGKGTRHRTPYLDKHIQQKSCSRECFHHHNFLIFVATIHHLTQFCDLFCFFTCSMMKWL